jgi:hypothetical protein
LYLQRLGPETLRDKSQRQITVQLRALHTNMVRASSNLAIGDNAMTVAYRATGWPILVSSLQGGFKFLHSI